MIHATTTLEQALDALACPRCGGSLAVAEERVRCEKCGAEYPVRDGILDFLSPLDNKNDP